MRIWEVREGHYDPYYDERHAGGRNYDYNECQHGNDSYEAGYEAGWKKAMERTYGERSIHRSGDGLNRVMYGMRGGDEMWDDYDNISMRRVMRDSRGRFM